MIFHCSSKSLISLQQSNSFNLSSCSKSILFVGFPSLNPSKFDFECCLSVIIVINFQVVYSGLLLQYETIFGGLLTCDEFLIFIVFVIWVMLFESISCFYSSQIFDYVVVGPCEHSAKIRLHHRFIKVFEFIAIGCIDREIIRISREICFAAITAIIIEIVFLHYS